MQRALLCADCSRLACTATGYVGRLLEGDKPVYLLQRPLPFVLQDSDKECIGHIDSNGGVHVNVTISSYVGSLTPFAEHILGMFKDTTHGGTFHPFALNNIDLLWLHTFHLNKATIIVFLQVNGAKIRLLFYGSGKKKNSVGNSVDSLEEAANLVWTNIGNANVLFSAIHRVMEHNLGLYYEIRKPLRECSKDVIIRDWRVEIGIVNFKDIYLLQCTSLHDSRKKDDVYIGSINPLSGVHVNKERYDVEVQHLINATAYVLKTFMDTHSDKQQDKFEAEDVTLIKLHTFNEYSAKIIAFFQVSNRRVRLLFYGLQGSGASIWNDLNSAKHLFDAIETMPDLFKHDPRKYLYSINALKKCHRTVPIREWTITIGV